jgi:hypothetical protein
MQFKQWKTMVGSKLIGHGAMHCEQAEIMAKFALGVRGAG